MEDPGIAPTPLTTLLILSEADGRYRSPNQQIRERHLHLHLPGLLTGFRNAGIPKHVAGKVTYTVPNCRSPASPRPGTMNPISFSRSSTFAVTTRPIGSLES